MQTIKEKKTVKPGERGKGSITPSELNLWTHLHALSQHWLSDLEFYEDELSFFRILIDKHLELFLDQKNIDQTRAIVSQLQQLEKRRVNADQKIKKHLKHISELIENPFVQNAQAFKAEHESLETEYLDFVMQFRNVKREVFKLTGRIVRSKKISRLIERT